jgi:hypothetical protein
VFSHSLTGYGQREFFSDQRLEEARVKEQTEDFARQEKILKLISTELTRNTTRVVEMAVKSEVQNSVLPSLEHITQVEVKSALSEQIGRGLAGFIQQVRFLSCKQLYFRTQSQSIRLRAFPWRSRNS